MERTNLVFDGLPNTTPVSVSTARSVSALPYATGNAPQRVSPFVRGPSITTGAGKRHERSSGSRSTRTWFGSGESSGLWAKDVELGDCIAERYDLRELLGSGAFGEVWRADDRMLPGQTVAVKFLHRWHAGNADASRRFEREAKVLRMLQHKHVVAMRAYGQDHGRQYLILDFVEGRTLRTILDEYAAHGKQPPETWIREVFGQICQGVAAMHALPRGGPIVHRDLKPENIMITNSSHDKPFVKILDLGLARLGPRELTQSGVQTGTKQYMAPEQAFCRPNAIVPSTDVFALAVLFIELHTLQNELGQAHPWWFVARLGQDTIDRALRSLPTKLPRDALDVLVASLHPNAFERLHDAETFHALLDCGW